MQRRGELQPSESQPYNVDEQLAKAPTSQSGDGRTGFQSRKRTQAGDKIAESSMLHPQTTE